jgi:NTP pyrophosphatase (non-canonical NTP hydrolase)
MDITLNQLIEQCSSDSNRWFPGKAQALENQVLCMAGEVGEVANHVKKVVRGSVQLEDIRSDLADEIVDVLIYLANLMGNEVFKDVDWYIKLALKQAFNESRFGTNRNAYQTYRSDTVSTDMDESL